jgi:hypothetical protein
VCRTRQGRSALIKLPHRGAAFCRRSMIGMDVAFSIHSLDFGRDDEPDLRGYLVVWPLDDGTAEAILYVRPGSEVGDPEQTRADCCRRIERLFSVGPVEGGWQRRESDNGWQTWLRGPHVHQQRL